MDINYLITEKVYEHLIGIQKELENSIEDIKISLSAAVELGDLSENFAFEYASNKLSVMTRVYEKNNEYIDKAEIVTSEYLEEKRIPLYKKFTLLKTYLEYSPIKRETEQVILIPDILIRIDEPYATVSSDIGKYLSQNEDSFWIDNDSVKVSVEKCEDSCLL